MVKYAVNVRTREDASGPVEAPAVSDVKKRIRAVCQGNAICPAGTLDCCSLAWELRIRYRDCPVKIGVFGCSGPCLRAAGHRGCYDYEICGGCMVQPETQYCIHCGKCEKLWSKAQLRNLVDAGQLWASEYEEIVGEPFPG